ncbi:hypothetical protein CONLIGDRAFT_653146 [Coniochaeta ligniaria NRRL 30616]|uniref:protein-ribulosamine 3-kinase n=1 Tax=Coniochaeta ligniaria NRRL 30616 TaxID=1408157 RepID=A0A1J7IYW3_9PEZI|nr:hypothetical protein CONLIGDRAFT_653146 [Coniochaeta ligniaria NRRL 30616]
MSIKNISSQHNNPTLFSCFSHFHLHRRLRLTASASSSKKRPLSRVDAISVKDVAARQNRGFSMDEAVIQASRANAWIVTGRFLTHTRDGAEKAYFLKVYRYGEHGGVILQGEFKWAKEIYMLCSHLIPKPLGYGRYKVVDPITHLYLSGFVDMIAQEERVTYGQVGFHVVTCDGKMPHPVDWQDSWAVFFRRLLLGVCKLDLETNGRWPEMECATQQLADKVIPRLLGNMRHEGKPIKPCIIHGDLWEPNLGINMETGDLIMYDVGSYYAHNEMDLGQWRADFCSHLRSKIYSRKYLRYYPSAEPVEEFDDRNRLYSLKGTINYSAGHPGYIVFDRQTRMYASAYNNMCYLCEKYAPIDGIDKYDSQKNSSVTGARLVSTFTKPPQ